MTKDEFQSLLQTIASDDIGEEGNALAMAAELNQMVAEVGEHDLVLKTHLECVYAAVESTIAYARSKVGVN